MPTIYEPADSDVHSKIYSIATTFHGELVEAGVTISALFAANEDGAAVKLNGYPCAAVVKINSYKDRVEGKADATITLDKDEWDGATPDQRTALLDHEITHLELKLDPKTNKVKRDDLGRPKLGMKLHDVQHGWFHSVAHRHGLNSYEVRQARTFADEHGQTYFGWVSPPSNGEGVTAQTGSAVDGFADDDARWKDKQQISKPVAQAMKDLVSVVGKEGIDSIEMSGGGETVVIDKAAAKRVRANADAIIREPDVQRINDAIGHRGKQGKKPAKRRT